MDNSYSSQIQGVKPYQEDRCATMTSKNGLVKGGFIADGHGYSKGLFGAMAAEMCVEAFEEFVEVYSEECEAWSLGEWKERLTVMFKLMDKSIKKMCLMQGMYERENGTLQTREGDNFNCGSTVTIVFQLADKSLLTANVGDSEAVLFFEKGKYQILTADHSPSNPEEFQRLRALNPLVEVVYSTPSGLERFADAHGKIIPPETYKQGVYPKNVSGQLSTYVVSYDKSLNLSRSCGDTLFKPAGVTCEPSFGYVPFTRGGLVVIASDGFWDSFPKGELNPELHPQKIFSDGVEKATRMFKNNYDDITLVSWSF